MPTYEYFCPENEQTVEVLHKMSEKLVTWGELCERSGTDPGKTPSSSPIQRMISGGQLMLRKSGGGLAPMPAPKPSGGGHCCGGGSCSH